MNRAISVFLAWLVLIPSIVLAGKLSVSVSYIPMTVPREEVMPENPLNDNYHRIPVAVPGRIYEPEGYYVVLEGAELPGTGDETITLRGFSVNRSYVLAKVNGGVLFENKEKVSRRFTVVEETGAVTKDFEVAPTGTSRYVFTRTGTYTFIDMVNPTAKVFVRVLADCGLYPVRGPSLKVDIPALSPGTYAIKVFYAFRQIFQEDFAMVGDAVQAVNYSIVNREVFRDDSTTFTGGRIVSAPSGARGGPPAGATAAPMTGASRNQP